MCVRVCACVCVFVRCSIPKHSVWHLTLALTLTLPLSQWRRCPCWLCQTRGLCCLRRHWVDVCGCEVAASSTAAAAASVAAFVYLFVARLLCVPFFSSFRFSSRPVGRADCRRVTFSVLCVYQTWTQRRLLHRRRRCRRRRLRRPLAFHSARQQTRRTHTRERERERLPNETRTQQTRFLLDFIVAVFVVAAELRTTQAESRRSRQNDTHTPTHTEHNIIITITTTKQSGAPLLFRCRRLVVSPRLTDEHVRFVRFVSIRFVLALERTERTEHERVCTACCHCRCRCRCPRRCHCGLTYWL